MNFPGQQLYAPYDRSALQIHNSNSVDYIQSVGQITNLTGIEQDGCAPAINNQVVPNYISVQTPTDAAGYLPVYDPNCQAYLNQVPQTINGPIYQIPSMATNNALNYPYGYASDNSFVGFPNAFVNNSEFYRNFVNYNRNRQFSPHLNYQANHITVLNNQVSVGESFTTNSNDLVLNNKECSNQNISIEKQIYNSQDGSRNSNFRRNFKSIRNKAKPIINKSLSGISDISTRSSKQSPVSTNPHTDDLDNSISPGQFVELIITNLDYNISAKEWKKLLFNQFQNVIKRVVNVFVQTNADCSNCAIVRLASLEDARLAISQFHRKKIGYKRIQVNLASNNINTAPNSIKHEVAYLLKTVAGYSLSVFKFMELYEKRYQKPINISDFYKMRDFVEVKDVGGNQNGKIISLTNTAINYITQTDPTNDPSVTPESPICTIHCKEGTDDYITAMDCSFLPYVKITLKVLKNQLIQLLQTHNGSLPLMSFMSCYKSEFNDIIIVKDQNVTFTQEDNKDKDGFNEISDGVIKQNEETKHFNEGVPLEHLIICVQSVKIVTANNGIRKIIIEDKKDISNKSISDNSTLSNYQLQQSGLGGILIDRLHQFSREVIDLMKHQTGCRMLLSKFIPTYHHHFGKQCRVADYGFSKLHELIEALPHVVHVIGTGYVRTLYLSHKVQLRRFTNELTKVLKSQNSKMCSISEYPILYKQLFHKEFNITDYGVCYIEDFIYEIPESTIDIIKVDNENPNSVVYISLPKRIQTFEEKERTYQFAIEVFDLLKQSPRCRLPFNKFIPSYHHHFSRQCKVADYGFTKLMELLEAIPQVVQIIEDHGEKYVVLTHYELLKVFAEQTLTMLEKEVDKQILVSEFLNNYIKTYGYSLNFEDYQVSSLEQLIGKIPKIATVQNKSVTNNSVRVVNCSDLSLEDGDVKSRSNEINVENRNSFVSLVEPYVCLADRMHVKYLAYKVLLILLEVSDCFLPDYVFIEKYQHKYRDNPDMIVIQNELTEIVQIKTNPEVVPGSGATGVILQLQPLIILAKDIRDLLKCNQCKMLLTQLEASYEQHFGVPLVSQKFGYPSLISLMQACSFAVLIKGRGVRATLILNQDFIGKLSYRVAFNVNPISELNQLSDVGPTGETDKVPISMTLSNTIKCTPDSNNKSSTIMKVSQQVESSLLTPVPASTAFASTVNVPSTLSSTFSKPFSNSAACSTQSPCFIPQVFNPNIYTPNNFMTMNSYHSHPPTYFSPASVAAVYNPWMRHNWYQNSNQQSHPSPNNTYNHYAQQSMYHQNDFSIISISPTANSNINAPLNSASSNPAPLPYGAANQDQKQIDELVETLAYDNSSNLTTSPNSTAQFASKSYDSNYSLFNNQWANYSLKHPTISAPQNSIANLNYFSDCSAQPQSLNYSVSAPMDHMVNGILKSNTNNEITSTDKSSTINTNVTSAERFSSC